MRRRRRCLRAVDLGGVLAGLCFVLAMCSGMAHALCVAGWRTAGGGWMWRRGLRMAACWRLKLIVPTSVLLCINCSWRASACRRWRCGFAGVVWRWRRRLAFNFLDLSVGGARPDVLERPTMFPTAHALLHALPDARLAEVFDTPAAGPVRIERIVSHGQASPEDFGMTRRRRSG